MTDDELEHGLLVNVAQVVDSEVKQIFGSVQDIVSQHINTYCNQDSENFQACCQLSGNVYR